MMPEQHHYRALAINLFQLLADGQKYTKEKLAELLGNNNGDTIDTILQILSDSGIWVTVNNGHYQLAQRYQRCEQQLIQMYYNQRGRVRLFAMIDSTNTYLLNRASKLALGDACIAQYQWKGRGRQNNCWLAPFGTNALFSMYWCFPPNTNIIQGISLAIGLALAENLIKLGVPDILLKWPNDLYIHGRKLAGILTETIFTSNKLVHVVVGAGINLTAKGVTDTCYSKQTISLQELGISLDVNQIIGTTLAAWHQTFSCMVHEGLTPFINRWSKLDALQEKTIKLKNGLQEITGLYKGIDKHGALLLYCDGQMHTFNSGQVTNVCPVIL